ncbi:polymorphic outer membrane protein middle domain-containing protein [Candidatus Chlamydia sanziniae]|uniref:Outer membrane protein 5 n=1 Tax=Candidatus Chlamydia sanziniae TaxID=1806891 RepID=A0A1A9HVI4_9CHLA|nr:polymorphic outer membrane protein middle domain-containing protein [Candidatus Chlamydia sanziniae]ANH78845.1 outer membrane protein 5 [Candidatus Chlamydia sanziniae]
MKFSLQNQLIISALIVPIFSLFAAVDEINLTRADSFYGTDGTAFVTKTTTNADGTHYIFTDSVSIANVSPPDGGVTATSCFKETAGTLKFKGNGYSFTFDRINASTAAGAVISNTAINKSVTLTGFSILSFTQAPAITDVSGAGTINVADTLIFKENSTILFENNSSTSPGGAIKAKTLSITGTNVFMSFKENIGQKGAAIAATDGITISENPGIVIFQKNVSKSSGGAIDCSASSAQPELILSGNRSLSFIKNLSASSGGAINTGKLVLSSGGPTIFDTNQVTTGNGGAIKISSSGELSLSADKGDITFIGNVVGVGTTRVHNAAYLEAGAKLTDLRAAFGQSIFFYDPITVAGSTVVSDVLNINHPVAGSTRQYNGMIVFSGEQLTPEESKKPENLTSTLLQPIALQAGTLALRQGAVLGGSSFTQETGSTLLMDVGTELKANAEDILLTSLAINTSSLGNSGIIKLTVTAADKKILISGPIKFLDSTGNMYEDSGFMNAHKFSLLELTAPGGITLTGVPATVEETPHYGYQGYWTITWKNTTEKVKTASFEWTKTGYNPNPERRASLVPNTLWGSFVDIRGFQRLVEANTESAIYNKGLWVAGISNFFHRNSMLSNRGFRHVSTGAVLGATTQTAAESILTIAFGQLFSWDKDYLVNKNRAYTYMGSLGLQHEMPLFSVAQILLGTSKPALRLLELFSQDLPTALYAQLSYSHVDNRMITRYTHHPETQDSWDSSTWAGELSGRLPLRSGVNDEWLFSEYSPFFKVQVVYIHRGGFTEKEEQARTFSSGNLLNISLPVGIKLEKIMNNAHGAYDLILMYVPDVYRRNPDNKTSLVISGDSWTTKGTNLARQALIAGTSTRRALSTHAELCSHFAFEWRGSSRNYNVDLGSKIQF